MVDYKTNTVDKIGKKVNNWMEEELGFVDGVLDKILH